MKRRAGGQPGPGAPSADDLGSEADLSVGPLIVDAGTVEVDLAPVGRVNNLERTPPALREVLDDVMALVREVVPGVLEKWMDGWRVFILKAPPPRSRMFGYVSVLVDRVRVGLPPVDDPEGLLESVKNRRFLQRDLRQVSEVRARGFAELIARAAAWEPPKRPRRG